MFCIIFDWKEGVGLGGILYVRLICSLFEGIWGLVEVESFDWIEGFGGVWWVDFFRIVCFFMRLRLDVEILLRKLLLKLLMFIMLLGVGNFDFVVDVDVLLLDVSLLLDVFIILVNVLWIGVLDVEGVLIFKVDLCEVLIFDDDFGLIFLINCILELLIRLNGLRRLESLESKLLESWFVKFWEFLW